jgi:hypothetical protein
MNQYGNTGTESVVEKEQPFIEKGEQSFTQDGFFAMRIDTQPLMRKIEMFLNSTRTVLKQDDKGMWYEELARFGEPLCNSEGVNGVMKIIEMVINPQNVQGNITSVQYEEIRYYARTEIASAIISNCVDWQIKDNKLKMIIDSIMRSMELFLTRLINNKERESYGKLNVQARETIISNPSGAEQFAGAMGGR